MSKFKSASEKSDQESHLRPRSKAQSPAEGDQISAGLATASSKSAEQTEEISGDGQTEKHSGKRSYFSLDGLTAIQRRELLALFASEVRKTWLSTANTDDTELGEEGNRKEESEKITVMQNVTSKAQVRGILPKDVKIPSRQWTGFFRALFLSGEVRLGNSSAIEKKSLLRESTPWGQSIRAIEVSPGNDKDVFDQMAAEHFVKQLFFLGQKKKSRRPGVPMNVGIVSGHTVAGILKKAVETDWKKGLGLSAAELPQICIYALNVCLTVDAHLSGNANILVHLLRQKISNEKGDAKAFGLSAPLLVERDKLHEVDRAPQTVEVVKVTEPYRLPRELRNNPDVNVHDSDLDIILTGVGELPLPDKSGNIKEGSSAGSIFFNLAGAFGFKMEHLVKHERIVGDIAFSGIRADGEPVALRRHIDSFEIIESDIPDAKALIAGLLNAKNPLSKLFLEKDIGSKIRALTDLPLDFETSKLKSELAKCLNELAMREEIDWDSVWRELPISDRLQRLITEARKNTPLRNRYVLEAAYNPLISSWGTEYVFYSAVQLAVLDEMAKEESKAVILVARDDGTKYKVPSIYASVAGAKHRYVSQLVIDEDTALGLLNLSAPDWARNLYRPSERTSLVSDLK